MGEGWCIVAGIVTLPLCLAACAPSLPTLPSDDVTVEGYLSAGPGFVRLHPDRVRRSNQQCIQLLRRVDAQRDLAPTGRVRATGRLGVFDDVAELAALQIGSDHAKHELCEARYMLVDTLSPIPGT